MKTSNPYRRLGVVLTLSGAVLEYMLDIVAAVRQDPDVAGGPSPRGAISLYKCCRARALLEKRDYVIPDDVKHLAGPTLSHRINIKAEAEMEGVEAELIVDRALSRVAVPRV